MDSLIFHNGSHNGILAWNEERMYQLKRFWVGTTIVVLFDQSKDEHIKYDS